MREYPNLVTCLISEAGVVSVLHDGHDLDRVVADLLDAGQHVVGKRPVGVDLALGRTGGVMV